MSSILPAIGKHAAAATKRAPRRSKTSMDHSDDEEVYERPRETPLSPIDRFARRASTPTHIVKNMTPVLSMGGIVVREAPVGWATKESVASKSPEKRRGNGDPVAGTTAGRRVAEATASPEQRRGIGGPAPLQQFAEDVPLPVRKQRVSLFAVMNQEPRTQQQKVLPKAPVNLEDKALLDALYKIPPRQEALRRQAKSRSFLKCQSSKVSTTLVERVQKLRAYNALRAPEPEPEPEAATVRLKPRPPVIEEEKEEPPKFVRKKFVDPLSCDLGVRFQAGDEE